MVVTAVLEYLDLATVLCSIKLGSVVQYFAVYRSRLLRGMVSIPIIRGMVACFDHLRGRGNVL